MINMLEVCVYFVGILTVIYGCSEPEGGYREPTPAENVHFATHVVVGKVTELIQPDPMFGDTYLNSTYGATVVVQCTYKGGPLPGQIQIGGAGFIPGHCTSKDLQKGNNYLLFLYEKRMNKDMYEQSQTAVLKDKIMAYLNVCELNMQYPMENGMILKRLVCPPATKLSTCQRHGDMQPTDEVTLITPIKQKPIFIEENPLNAEEDRNPVVGRSASDTGSGVAVITASLTAVLCSILAQFV